MPWDAASAQRFQELAGVYALPGGCWAVLKVNPAPSKTQGSAQAVPEGYDYAWAILAPGAAPKRRGHRMAGVDNSDDKHVRDQISANAGSPMHRAHRHAPDWKNVVSIKGQDWPVAARGVQLAQAPATPGELWMECMACLKEILAGLGLDVPNEMELLAGRMDEEEFRRGKSDQRRDQGPGLEM